jgi:predicted GNAT family acetyltransferase
MSSFDIVHHDRVVGKLSMFDRMVFKGHLTGLMPDGAFAAFLSRQGVLLKDFAPFVKAVSDQLKAHVRARAADAGCPYLYLESAHTKARGRGLSHLLVAGGIEHARRNGVRLLEACPMRESKDSRSIGLFVGSARVFEKAGFATMVERKSGRPLMRLELTN